MGKMILHGGKDPKRTYWGYIIRWSKEDLDEMNIRTRNEFILTVYYIEFRTLTDYIMQ